MADVRAAPDDDHLTRTPRRVLGASTIGSVLRVSVLGGALFLGGPAAVLANDPTLDPGATARPATCAERFPEDGLGGVDLRLGCVVSEVVGLYTAGQQAPPPALSSYAIVVASLVLGVVVLAFIAGRLLARRAGRRLAPVLAGEWWVCGSCRSVNGAGVEHCYSCGASRPVGPTLRTDDAPATPQSFGSTRKRG